MLETILSFFPPNVHKLTLVSDPDHMLDDERVSAELYKRGFTLINESDPVRLRYRYSHTSPPWIISTTGPINQLPYDLWAEGQRVSLALHDFFPDLSYPVVETLTPAQRERLSVIPQPDHHLGQRATLDFLLDHVFGLKQATISNARSFLSWLSGRAETGEPLPDPIRDELLARLRRISAYRDWPLETLLTQPEALPNFLQTQWLTWLEKESGQQIAETSAAYVVGFNQFDWQDLFQPLLRSGLLRPIKLPHGISLPDWAIYGRIEQGEDVRLRRYDDLLDIVAESLGEELTIARWAVWKTLSEQWAQLTSFRYAPELDFTEKTKKDYEELASQIDAYFLTWLKTRYTPLAAQQLPEPHHLFHVPEYLAYYRRQENVTRIALIILDGMSLSDWRIVKAAWTKQHPDWHFESRSLLAQIPTLTAVSRQALVSGRRPIDFAETITYNQQEPKEWQTFWQAHDLPEDAIAYQRYSTQEPDAAYIDARTQALCVIVNDLDKLTHSAHLGARDAQASLNLWLREHDNTLETLLQSLLDEDYAVFLTSDHGHIQAVGIGQPSEGLTVQTRSKRARTYRDQQLALQVQSSFPDTYLWHKDGLLPEELWVLMPNKREAFARWGEICVTHGGTSVDEMIVPFIHLTQK